jgi:hypothetical protein
MKFREICGNGVTLVLKESGEFRTILKSGEWE